MAHLLEVRDLSVRFHTAGGIVDAVRGVGWHLDRGETLAILGESGSGKSVSASAIMNLIDCPPAEIVSGDRRATLAPHEYVFDDPVQVAIYVALQRASTCAAVMRALAQAGIEVRPDQLERFIRELRELGLVFEDAGQFVALATRDDPSRVRVQV